MGTTANEGKGSQGRAANGDRQIGASSCRREQHATATCQTPPRGWVGGSNARKKFCVPEKNRLQVHASSVNFILFFRGFFSVVARWVGWPWLQGPQCSPIQGFPPPLALQSSSSWQVAVLL